MKYVGLCCCLGAAVVGLKCSGAGVVVVGATSLSGIGSTSLLLMLSMAVMELVM